MGNAIGQSDDSFFAARPTRPARIDPLDALLRALIVMSVLGLVFYCFHGHVFAALWAGSRARPWYALFERPSLIWAAMGLCMLLVRTLLWFSYRPFPTQDERDAPVMTVIIPAYNEGPMVAKSIESVAAARYPRDRLEIIAVDDGSRDDTWEHLLRAAARYPDLVRPVRFDKNQGKRAALAKGFLECRGEIVVTIDSDSVIEADTLLAAAGPFRDARVGAVAGKVLVYNRDEGLIPRMLHVRFILSFDFLRAAQSTYGIVFCCPGALSAYRTSVVREVLEPWIRQKFMGIDCTYGEDRALTNYILGKGLKAVYQRTAVVHTVVPATYAKLCKMFLRWDRSYIREEFHFFRVFGRQPLGPRLIALVEALLADVRYPIGWMAYALMIIMTLRDPATFVRVMVAVGMMSFLNMLYYLHSERSWRFTYGVLYSYFDFFALFWIFPYALLTVRSRSWMTR